MDLARLQLAIRSLERSNPVIRVALLGLGSNGPPAARKLARALLSDALGQEEAWETEMLAIVSDGRSLLLKYGDQEGSARSNNPLVKSMNIPSPFLERNNLEILITPLNTDGNASASYYQAALQDAIVVPPLTTPNSAGGRVGFVRYPMHKAVIVAEGIAGAIEYGKFPSSLEDGTLIKAAISLPLRPSEGVKSAEQEATGNTVDIDLATHALEIFRTSKSNGAQFSEEWQTSRLPALSEWIAGPKITSSSDINIAVHDLISSVLSTTSTSIAQAEATESTDALAATIPETKRTMLQSAISEWSAEAHRDLQLNLDSAFNASSSWRRTAWWRLFWRIDDVTISASEILRGSWLTEAEQRLAFLSGRLSESGLASAEQLRGPSPKIISDARREEMEEYERNVGRTETVAELRQLPSLLARMQQQSGVNTLFNPPWSQTINLSRQYMLHTLVPGLHSKAQALLLTTLGTIGGSAALAAWFYAATAGIALYESGAIISLGLVWSLRRLQKKWSKEREQFAGVVREDARRVLGEVESHLRKIVDEGGRVQVKAEDVRNWREAREGVERCREALDAIRSRS